MANANDHYALPLDEAVDFLKNILPFNTLEQQAVVRLARECVIDFFPKGTMIFRQEVTKVESLYLIQQGGVRSYLKDDEGELTLKDYRGQGEYFGALPIIQGTLANLNVETVEDTFCFLISKKVFQALLLENHEISQYFLRTMSAKLVKNVYVELRQHKMSPRSEGALFLFSTQVGAVAKSRLFTAPMETTVRQAAVMMSENFIGSLLLTDASGKVAGIVTDRDIRSKVVAKGLDYSTKLSEIMSSPLQTISSHAICFDALLTMMKNRIQHLAIENQGEVVKMITTHDIMVEQGTSPLYLFREIVAQRRISGLYSLSRKVPKVVRALIEEGAKANNVTRMITVLNDHILDRLLSLALEEFGPAPLPFAWLLLGSEGRQEQTFKTDQDNALLYADTDDPALKARAEEYFKEFAEAVINHLVQCGYPLCPGEIMASNPKWRQPLAAWSGYFQNWCMTPVPESVLNSTIFFDFRCSFGDNGLVESLRSHLQGITRRADLFFLYLATNILGSRPPMSFFKNFIVEKDGEHRNTFDLKTKGLVFFVDFARLMALKYSVGETNTLDRLRVLHQEQYIPQALCTEVIEAYEFLMHVRLVHQLRMLEEEREPDNYINPRDLSDLERQTLKEAFHVIRRMQEFLRLEFPSAEI